MNLWRKLHLRLRALFQKRQLDAEMDEEMRSHIEMQTQENIEEGMNVSGGMKVEENGRFEIPSSSVGFSSHASP